LLTTSAPGVTLNVAELTHQIKRQSHVEITLPYFNTAIDHINTALAQVKAVDEDEGRVLIYDLDANDLVTVKNKRNSRLAIGGFLKVPANQVNVIRRTRSPIPTRSVR